MRIYLKEPVHKSGTSLLHMCSFQSRQADVQQAQAYVQQFISICKAVGVQDDKQ